MKAIMVMFDSLNRRLLPPYGCDWTHAPNFSRLAERTVRFDSCYVGSMPCMPARRELHTGRYNFLHRSWGPLEPFDDSMPAALSREGVHTHLTSDHYHYWEDGGATYHTQYGTWEFHRGQEGDPWIGQVADPDIPAAIAPREGIKWRQDWVNRLHMEREQDQPQAKTMASGLDFIERNHDQDNWFLQIETFDPHEPFYTSQHYKDLYPDDWDGDHFDWPPYREVEEDEATVRHMRHQYVALLSMCDRYLGEVLDQMDRHDMWNDTMLIVCTDHGFFLGEKDWWAKLVPPWYNELANTPLFVWDPRCRRAGESRSQLVQMIDMAPTLLDFFGVDVPADTQGVPLGPVLADNAPTREAALFGHFGGQVNVTDGRFVYMRGNRLGDDYPLYDYTLMPTRMDNRFRPEDLQDTELARPFGFTKGCPVLRIPAEAFQAQRGRAPHPSMLFDLENDPDQNSPLQDPEQERRMQDLMVGVMLESEAPPEQFRRIGLDHLVDF